MYKVKESSQDEMVLEFLKMEIESERFAGDIKAALRSLGAGAEPMLRGDSGNKEQNALRREVLGIFRGYGRNERLFKNFPCDIRWVWAVLENDDLHRISYINYSYWNELSGFTGSPLEAARAIRAGKTAYGVGNDGFFKAEEDLRRGAAKALERRAVNPVQPYGITNTELTEVFTLKSLIHGQ